MRTHSGLLVVVDRIITHIWATLDTKSFMRSAATLLVALAWLCDERFCIGNRYCWQLSCGVALALRREVLYRKWILFAALMWRCPGSATGGFV